MESGRKARRFLGKYRWKEIVGLDLGGNCAAGEIWPDPDYISKVKTRFTDKFCVDDKREELSVTSRKLIILTPQANHLGELKRCRFPRALFRPSE